MNKKRCVWCLQDPLYIDYHDKEWGVAVHDDQKLFECLSLEGFQAGLSWITVLKKRDAFRELFANFDPAKVARFSQEDVERIVLDARIIRHRGKIEAIIGNAQAFLTIQREEGCFDAFIWQFSDEKAMSKKLKGYGFKFVGPTICYAFMQAVGIVNDHEKGCFLR